MKREPKALRRYLAATSGALLCERKKKRAILSDLKESVGEYAASHPDVSPETLASVFGSPEEIAASALQGEDLPALKRKTVVRRVVLAAMLAALLIWAAFAVASFIDVHNEAHGYFEEGVSMFADAEEGGSTA